MTTKLVGNTLYDMPKGQKLHIDEIWAFLSVDEEGDEGIVAITSPLTGLMLPLIAADRERLDQLKPMAQRTARDTGRKVRLCKFHQRTEVEELNP